MKVEGKVQVAKCRKGRKKEATVSLLGVCRVPVYQQHKRTSMQPKLHTDGLEAATFWMSQAP